MWSDFTFPAGNMREPWCGRHRADLIVVNKCPSDLSLGEKQQIERKLNVSVPVFFTTIEYGQWQTLSGAEPAEPINKAIAVAGIGRPEPFFKEVQRRIADVELRTFADHYQFTTTDVQQLSDQCRAENRTIVTTEKDAMRLREFVDNLTIKTENVVYLPIRLRVLFSEADMLNTKILNYVREFDRENK